ncbi:MAG: hypothetical protein AB2L12_08260 [Smithellaceae bacterium]
MSNATQQTAGNAESLSSIMSIFKTENQGVEKEAKWKSNTNLHRVRESGSKKKAVNPEQLLPFDDKQNF